MISSLKNGNGGFSFSRVAALFIILIGMGMGIWAIETGLKGNPVVINNQAVMMDKVVQVDKKEEVIQIPVRSIEWDALGTFWYNLALGTTLLVTGLYGVNKAADVVGKFADRRKPQ